MKRCLPWCRDSDCDMMEKINKQSTLELKTLVIAETVVPYDDRALLSTYVKQQLDASDVISDGQKEAVLTMVNLAPMESSVNKEDIGEKGTLRNSAVLALIKRHLNNVHFLLIGYYILSFLNFIHCMPKMLDCVDGGGALLDQQLLGYDCFCVAKSQLVGRVMIDPEA